MLVFVGGALHQSKIAASPEFSAASATHSVDQYESQPIPGHEYYAGKDTAVPTADKPDF
jgi:hypothetical protein